MPVFIHPTQPVPTPRAAKFGLNQTVQYTFDTTLCVGSLIEGGVLDRFPTLRLLLSHGGGAFPYLLGRFDCMHARMASGHGHSGGGAASLPSNYLRHFHYDTLLHDARALRFLAELVSVDRLVLGSDYSFPPADRDPVASVRKAGFGDAEITRILEQNPRELFTRLAGC
jgi:aminocarboxymuconate-semialdehyde decarboxylase